MLDASYPERFRTVCEEVSGCGWRRVILLGDDLVQGPYTLKACLAQVGVMVFAPAPQDRTWLKGLADEASERGEVPGEPLARFGSLLRDGMEHGVEALVVTDAALGALARSALPGVAMLEVSGGWQ